MKNKKLYYLGGGLLTAILAYVVYGVIKKKPTTFGEFADDTKSTISTATQDFTSWAFGSYKDQGFPLKRGSGGEDVRSLQKFLNAESGLSLAEDGKFGANTESAVLANQSPFATFKSMYPTAIKGQVSLDFFESNIKGKY